MSKVTINGQEMTAEEALALIERDETKITQVRFDLKNEEKSLKAIPLSDEGFEIPKEVIAELSQKMTELDAGRLTLTLSASPHIRGRTLKLVMIDPEMDEENG